MANRIELHTQLKAFYSIVFNGVHDIRPTHISLYMFLLNQNNRNNWAVWFKCPWDLAMQGAAIQSKTTYYAILDELCKFGLLQWEKGINLNKSPRIKLTILSVSKNDTLTGTVAVPLSDTIHGTVPDTLPDTLPGTLTGTLTGNNIILLTNNYTLLNKYESEFEKFISDLKNKEKKEEDFPGPEKFESLFGKHGIVYTEEKISELEHELENNYSQHESLVTTAFDTYKLTISTEDVTKHIPAFTRHLKDLSSFPLTDKEAKKYFGNWFKLKLKDHVNGTNKNRVKSNNRVSDDYRQKLARDIQSAIEQGTAG